MITRNRIVALLAVFASVCGGAMAADEYFVEVEAASMQFARDGADLADRYEARLEDGIAGLTAQYDLEDPAKIDALAAAATGLGISTTVDLLTARAQSYGRFIDELESLSPPSEAAATHEASLAALRDAVESLPATIDAVRGLKDIGELASAVAVSPFGVARERLGAACRDLESIAADEAIDVDLRCP
ncbi:MAG: hypothetical protein ACE5GC_02430 [Acidimicrobiia bacterium]